MITLVLNAAEARVQFVLADEERILCAEDWDAPSKGTELLPPLLHEALGHAGLCMGEVRRIACVAGPGSFTGLRLGLTLAAGLRRATGAQVAGLNYLQALATGAAPLAPLLASKRGGDELCVRVVTHARRGLVHCQDFQVTPLQAPTDMTASENTTAGEPFLPENSFLPKSPLVPALPLTEPRMSTVEDACIGFDQRPWLVLGSGVARNPEAFASTPAQVHCIARLGEHPTPEALLSLTRVAMWGDTDPDPLYLRPCDAVANLPAMAAKRGQAPEQAQAELERLLQPLHKK